MLLPAKPNAHSLSSDAARLHLQQHAPPAATCMTVLR
jgi:hypothetical protein